MTQNDLFPQVSNRADAYVFLTNNSTSIEYVLADSKSISYSQEIWGSQSIKDWIPYYISTAHYGVVVDDDGVLLLKANYVGPVLLSGSTTYRYNYQNLFLYSGSTGYDSSSTSGTIFVHNVGNQAGVTFWYGPYASLPPGQYEATFYLKSDATTNSSLILDVSNSLNATSSPSIGELTLTQASFPKANSWTAFSLTFDYTPQQSLMGKLEFRGVDVKGGPFYLDYIQVDYLGPPQR